MKEEEEEEKWVVGVRDDRKHRLSISKRSDNILTRLLATVKIFAGDSRSFLSSTFSITTEVTRSRRRLKNERGSPLNYLLAVARHYCPCVLPWNDSKVSSDSNRRKRASFFLFFLPFFPFAFIRKICLHEQWSDIEYLFFFIITTLSTFKWNLRSSRMQIL